MARFNYEGYMYTYTIFLDVGGIYSTICLVCRIFIIFILEQYAMKESWKKEEKRNYKSYSYICVYNFKKFYILIIVYIKLYI